MASKFGKHFAHIGGSERFWRRLVKSWDGHEDMAMSAILDFLIHHGPSPASRCRSNDPRIIRRWDLAGRRLPNSYSFATIPETEEEETRIVALLAEAAKEGGVR